MNKQPTTCHAERSEASPVYGGGFFGPAALRMTEISHRRSPGIVPRAAATSQDATAHGGAGMRWILATEQPAQVYDWQRGEFVNEVLLIDGIPIPDHLPLLDSHSRESVGNVIGSVRNIRVTTAGGYRALEGEVVFSEADDLSRAAAAKVAEGHITDGSIGYRVDKTTWIEEGVTANILGQDFSGPLKVTYRAELKEFSVCPIGADTLAKVRAALIRGQQS